MVQRSGFVVMEGHVGGGPSSKSGRCHRPSDILLDPPCFGWRKRSSCRRRDYAAQGSCLESLVARPETRPSARCCLRACGVKAFFNYTRLHLSLPCPYKRSYLVLMSDRHHGAINMLRAIGRDAVRACRHTLHSAHAPCRIRSHREANMLRAAKASIASRDQDAESIMEVVMEK